MNTEDRKKQWEEANEILNKTCKRHMVIWRTDANGELGSEYAEGNADKDNAQMAKNILGPYIRVAKAEEGNGAQLKRI